MQADLFRRTSPGLLVSVRNAVEAIAALAGGADIIDVKDPTRGSLGPADASAIDAVVAAVNRARPVTLAMGELIDMQIGNGLAAQRSIPQGVMAFKIGLAGCAKSVEWQAKWQGSIRQLQGGQQTGAPHPVGVAYADWRAAKSPSPSDVLIAAVELNCPAILVDTWDKSAGTLFEHWRADDLREFIDVAHRNCSSVVLAGSLGESGVADAACLKPDFIAVRTAACDGGRNGAVSAARVRRLKQAIAAAAWGPHRSVQVSF